MFASVDWIRNREQGFCHRRGQHEICCSSKRKADIYNRLSCASSWDPENFSQSSEPYFRGGQWGESGGIFGLDFCPDGSVLGAACERKSLLFLDPLTYKQIHYVPNAHANCVNTIKFLDNRRMLATCSDDHTVAVWDFRLLKGPVRMFRGHTNWVKNIEYLPEKGLLLTSGFDGYIYSWDINRCESDNSNEFTRLFYTPGLMRMCLTPDHSKMIVSTQWGYLFVIHHLDVEKMAVDLMGFKPNMYWLTMKSGTMFTTQKYFNMFNAKRNRCELIIDFPAQNDPENVTSVTPHPHSWAVLSRNTNHDEQSEWTCVHDVQLPPQEDMNLFAERRNLMDLEVSEYNANTNEELFTVRSGALFSDMMMEHFASTSSAQSTAGSSDFEQNSTSSTGFDVTSNSRGVSTNTLIANGRQNVIAVQVRDEENSNSLNANSANAGAVEHWVRDQAGPMRPPDEVSVHFADGSVFIDDGRGESQLRDWRQFVRPPTPAGMSSSSNNSGNAADEEVAAIAGGDSTNSNSNNGTNANGDVHVHVNSPEFQARFSFSRHMREPRAFFIRTPRVHNSPTIILLGRPRGNNEPRALNSGNGGDCIPRSYKRLTHFIEEPNVGRGFIKEVSWCSDGRVIASPFGFGVRLLSFDSLCSEMSDVEIISGQPKKLNEIKTNVSHNSVVLCTRFSPTHNLLASGCLKGKIAFHQPLFG